MVIGKHRITTRPRLSIGLFYGEYTGVVNFLNSDVIFRIHIADGLKRVGTFYLTGGVINLAIVFKYPILMPRIPRKPQAVS